MFDAASLGVAAAGFWFAGEHGAGLEERVPICFLLAKNVAYGFGHFNSWSNTSTAEQQIIGPKNSLNGRE